MNALSNILVQMVPPGAAEFVLYTVPVGNKALINELIVCSRSGGTETFRVSISVGGTATATKDYFYFDLPVVASDTFANEMNVTLNSGDVIRVTASTVNLTFILLGAIV